MDAFRSTISLPCSSLEGITAVWTPGLLSKRGLKTNPVVYHEIDQNTLMMILASAVQLFMKTSREIEADLTLHNRELIDKLFSSAKGALNARDG